MEMTGQSYLDTASYTCKTGYLREGPQHALVCSDQKRWEGDEITCTGILSREHNGLANVAVILKEHKLR